VIDAEFCLFQIFIFLQEAWNIKGLLMETRTGADVLEAGNSNQFLTNTQRCSLVDICVNKLCERALGSW